MLTLIKKDSSPFSPRHDEANIICWKGLPNDQTFFKYIIEKPLAFLFHPAFDYLLQTRLAALP